MYQGRTNAARNAGGGPFTNCNRRVFLRRSAVPRDSTTTHPGEGRAGWNEGFSYPGLLRAPGRFRAPEAARAFHVKQAWPGVEAKTPRPQGPGRRNRVWSCQRERQRAQPAAWSVVSSRAWTRTARAPSGRRRRGSSRAAPGSSARPAGSRRPAASRAGARSWRSNKARRPWS